MPAARRRLAVTAPAYGHAQGQREDGKGDANLSEIPVNDDGDPMHQLDLSDLKLIALVADSF